MSRKPVDQQQHSECRQAVWDEIRGCKGKTFSVVDIAKCVRLDPSSTREYIHSLVKAGYLGIHTIRKFTLGGNLYLLQADCGVDAPRVRKDGTPVTQGIGRKYLWNAMSTLKTFSLLDLTRTASTEIHQVAESEAASYCAALCLAGYLRKQTDGRYRLIKRTGPHPPQIQRTKQVYDPNLRAVVWSRVTGGAE
jgi:hypothetical protein